MKTEAAFRQFPVPPQQRMMSKPAILKLMQKQGGDVMHTIDGWKLLPVMLFAILFGLVAGKAAVGQHTVNLDTQQIDDPEMARCILEHHRVGSDAMTRYVIGACRTVVGAD